MDDGCRNPKSHPNRHIASTYRNPQPNSFADLYSVGITHPASIAPNLYNSAYWQLSGSDRFRAGG